MRASEYILTVVVDLDLSFLETSDLQRGPLLSKLTPFLAIVVVVVVVVCDPAPNLRRVHDDGAGSLTESVWTGPEPAGGHGSLDCTEASQVTTLNPAFSRCCCCRGLSQG